jgi:hypothetical protein
MAKATGGQGGGAPKPDRGGSQPGLSPNDDRSNVKNDNNSANAADKANQAAQKRGG